MRFTTKIGLIALLLAFILGPLVGLGLFLGTRALLERQAARDGVQIAQGMMREVDHVLSLAQRDIRMMAADEFLRQFVADPKKVSAPMLKDELEERGKMTGPWDTLMVVDAAGKILLSTGAYDIQGSVTQYRDSMAAYSVARTGATYYSDLVVSNVTGRPTVIFATPIMLPSEPEKVGGVLIGQLSWSSVLFVFNDLKSSTKAYLFNREGVVIGERSEDGSHILRKHLGDLQRVQKALKGEESGFSLEKQSSEGLDKETLVVHALERGFGAYKGNGWGLLLELPASEILLPARRVAGSIGILITLAMILASGIFVVLSRSLISPLRALEEGARRIGSGHLEQRVNIHTHDEIGALAASFNRMSEDLQRTTVSKGYMEKMIDTMASSLLVASSDGTIETANRATLDLLGYEKDELLGQPMEKVLAAEEWGGKPAALLIASDGVTAIDKTYLAKGGMRIPVLLSCTVMRGAKGDPQSIICGAQDITERKEKEKQREFQLFRDLLEHSNDAIEVIDPETRRFLDVNEKGCRDLGYSREELLSIGIPDVDTSFGSPSMAKIDEQLEKAGAALFETLHRRKDGSTFPVEVSVKLIDVGNKAYMLGIVRDITERKRTEESLRHANRALRTLSACNITLVHAVREEQLLADMCQLLVKEGSYFFASISLIAGDREKSLRQVASAGCEAGCTASLSINDAADEPGQTYAREAMRLGTPQIANNIPIDPQYASWREQALKCGYASFLALPLTEDRGELLGVLSIYATESDAFDDEEMRLLKELAGDLAFGIRSLRTRRQRDDYQQENLKSLGRLKESLLGTISAVAHMAEQRDPYTAGHQNRVADLACAIARELGLDANRIEGLRLGAMIHDIGKVSIPAEILNRPGKLSAPEFEIVRSHVQAGYDIVKDIAFPWPVAAMVLQHHERLDGSGYPQGLKGDAICLEARILAVADMVDAISAHRPYRPALGIEEALSIIEASKGQALDAKVVDACLRLFREKGYAIGQGGPKALSA